MESGITKNQSNFLYGIAILFMLYHHLYCIPERIQYEYFSLLDNIFFFIKNISIERKVAWFSKICVAIFAFLTGYGTAKTLKSNVDHNPFLNLLLSYKNIIIRILKLMLKLSLVLAVFLPLYYLFKNKTFSLDLILNHILGKSSSINGEWWYVKFYFGICFILPLINTLFTKGYKHLYSHIIFKIITIFIIEYIVRHYRLLNGYDVYLIIVIEGFIIARLNIFEFINKYIDIKYQKLISIFLLIGTIILRIIYASEAGYSLIDKFIIVPFIYSLCILFNNDSKVFKLIAHIGTHSTFMWLTHTFYMYYIFPRLSTILYVSTLIYIQSIIMALVTSYLLSFIFKYILKLIDYLSLLISKIFTIDKSLT